jgi:uncharacterized Zn finger protein (UPF0148 family)
MGKGGVVSEKHQCEGLLRTDSWTGRRQRCERRGTVERDGKLYCGTHDPVRIAERQAKRDAARDAERAERRARRARAAAIAALCKGVPTEKLQKLGPGWLAEKLKEKA